MDEYRRQRGGQQAEIIGLLASIMRRATDIDADVSDLLHRVGEGMGASLTGAANGVAVVPGPPPEPIPDAGAGELDSDPWWSRIDDAVTKQAVIAAAAAAEAIGWTDAARHLRHYLDGSGEDLIVDPATIMRDTPRFRSTVDETVRNEIDRAMQQATASGDYGVPTPFTTPSPRVGRVTTSRLRRTRTGSTPTAAFNTRPPE